MLGTAMAERPRPRHPSRDPDAEGWPTIGAAKGSNLKSGQISGSTMVGPTGG